MATDPTLPPPPLEKDTMTPLTLADAEADLQAAIDTGDTHRITAASAVVDHLDTRPTTVTLHAAALWYAEQGLKVFPLSPGSKIPFKGSNGCHGASNNVDVVDGWWADTPDANIGIATGHLVDVIDIDGPAGVQVWAQLIDDLPPIIGRVSTPRPGGNHLYVAAVPGRGNKAGLLPHIDYRGTGGYVVAPPSSITIGPNPGTYAWHRPLDLSALGAEVAA